VTLTSPRDSRSSSSPLGVVPAVARLAASAWWHAAERSVAASLHLGSRLARAARTGDATVLGASEPERARSQRDPAAGEEAAALRRRGEDLIRRSADVSQREELHPAYGRILDNLSPDEARMLRLFATSGPQPAIDIRRGLPLVSELVAPGINMIGAEAGCRYPERVPAYLNNLYRLGLLWFSRESLRDTNRYQVLEAQPEAIEALKAAGRTARTVRRSINLTPFGSDFCEVCLPLETEEMETRLGADGDPEAASEG
jgi:hypothetical protein